MSLSCWVFLSLRNRKKSVNRTSIQCDGNDDGVPKKPIEPRGLLYSVLNVSNHHNNPLNADEEDDDRCTMVSSVEIIEFISSAWRLIKIQIE